MRSIVYKSLLRRCGKISALLCLLLVSPLFTSCTTAESTSGKLEDGV